MWAGSLAQDWENLRLGGRWPQRLAPMAEPGALQMPSFCPAPEGADESRGMSRGGGHPRKRAGQAPRRPHPVTPADTPGTHWTPRTPTRKPNLETKAGHWGQILMERPGSLAGPTKGLGAGPTKGPGAGPAVGLGCTCHRCPGDGPLPERSAGPLSGAHRTCHTPDGRVLCKSVIGGRVKECGRAAGWGAICSLRPRAPAGIERPAGRPSLHCGFN